MSNEYSVLNLYDRRKTLMVTLYITIPRILCTAVEPIGIAASMMAPVLKWRRSAIGRSLSHSLSFTKNSHKICRIIIVPCPSFTACVSPTDSGLIFWQRFTTRLRSVITYYIYVMCVCVCVGSISSSVILLCTDVHYNFVLYRRFLSRITYLYGQRLRRARHKSADGVGRAALPTSCF